MQETGRRIAFVFNLFCFFIVLIKLHEDQAEAGNHDYLEKLYSEIKNAISPDSHLQNAFSKHFLRTLALIRLALMLNKTEEVKAMCNFPSIKSFPELATNEGIPPDWAFTILDYVFPIHCRLVKSDANAAYSLRNFLFKNFAFKLRGCKRVCVMATFFIGLSYDVESVENTRNQDIINIGEYVLTKFVTEKYLALNPETPYPEFRIYICFVCMFMAEMYAYQFCLEAASLFAAARVFKLTSAGYISEFLAFAIVATQRSGLKKRSKRQNENIFHKSRSERWKVAIVLPRIFDDQGQTSATVRWAERINFLLQGKES